MVTVRRPTSETPGDTSSPATPAGRHAAGRPLDRRIRRTRDLLHSALGELIHEKSYERVTVGEILARANVGRSAFYTHFRDKDDLLASCMRDMLAATTPVSSSPARSPQPDARVTAFSLPLLEHIHRRACTARIGGRARHVLHEHLRRVLAEHVSHAAALDEKGTRSQAAHISPELRGQFVASTFVLVLHWWLDRRDLQSPAEADETFRVLIASLVSGDRR
jgi:AcrR family transcriptional regulator